MRHVLFAPESNKYPIALLIKPQQLRLKELNISYVSPLHEQGVPMGDIVACDLLVSGKKTPVKLQKEYLADLLPQLAKLQVEWLVVCDGEYFKTLSKARKADRHVGYIEKCAIPGFEYMNVVYVPSYAGLFYDPTIQDKITAGLNALVEGLRQSYVAPGSDIIKFAEYPVTIPDIKKWLDQFIASGVDLTVDIETYGLKHYHAGLGTITFCWNKHEGIAFRVDHLREKNEAVRVRELLRHFFRHWKGKAIYHNISFDVTVLIYQLFMSSIIDNRGMLYGMEIMLRNWDCTKLITYLATNSCAGNHLSLKDQAQEFAGNYAVDDIKDINLIEPDELLKYNLVDGLSTWYVREKHWDTLVADQQLDIYLNLFQPAIKDIVQMQLTGMPIDLNEVARGKADMQAIREQHVATILSSPLIIHVENYLNAEKVRKDNLKLKTKVRDLSEVNEKFNPNSGAHLQYLLYTVMKLPVLAYTDTKQPSTEGKVIKSLVNHTTDPDEILLLEALLEFSKVEKILTSFIPAFEQAPKAPDGHHYLFGNYNLGGTVSGRLSSNGPNMQNMPATGSKYAKIIKRMFRAPKGWLFVGLDYASLEDRISALTTKDPNKLKVYTDGYDGHCLRAYAYFSEQMPNIDPNSVSSINSIADLYPEWRQKSKNPTFLLTYGGTYKGLMSNYGFSETFAQQIAGRYHELYSVSDEWVRKQIVQACDDGYVTVAFGLRVRTPLLAQVVLNTSRTPHAAEAEGRTAGNALGQSWGLLNSRSCMAFMQHVRASEWANDIRVCSQIHDAQYYLVRDNSKLLEWMNEKLVKEVQWQDDPLIWHDEVKLGGELSVFHPSWAEEMVIPNGASEQEILDLATQFIAPKEDAA